MGECCKVQTNYVILHYVILHNRHNCQEMNLLSAERGGSVDEEAYGQILNHLVDSKRFTFEDRYASLTEKQKTVLMAIASEFPSQVTLTSQDFMTRYNLKTASSVQTAVKGLVEKGILSDNHGIRRPTDLLFMLWLKDF